MDAETSSEQLFQAVEQLPADQLRSFVERVVSLHARRSARSLNHDEATLLLAINRGLSEDQQRRYEVLAARRRAETITSEEYDELIRLSTASEALDAERMKALAELSRRRQKSLAALMDELGLRPPAYE